MILTDDGLTDPTTLLTGRTDVHRQPITDFSAWLDGLDGGARSVLRSLGELLIGGADRDTADRFTAPCLGVADGGHVVDEALRRPRPMTRDRHVRTAIMVVTGNDLTRLARVSGVDPSIIRDFIGG